MKLNFRQFFRRRMLRQTTLGAGAAYHVLRAADPAAPWAKISGAHFKTWRELNAALETRQRFEVR